MQDKFLKINVSARIDVEHPAKGIRVYKSSPDDVTLQLWSNGPTAVSGGGKDRAVYSVARLNAQEIDALVRALLDAQSALAAA
jgi:hypothetical protein